MSRRSAQPPVQVQPDAVKPGDVLCLHYRDRWAATRFALPPFSTAQMRHALRDQLMLGRDQTFYRLDGLVPEKRGELLALLREQACRFEVWR